MPENARRAKPKRTITVADSDWERIRVRAKASGKPVSQYIVDRLAGPDRGVATPPSDTGEMLARVEMMTRFLFEVERGRLLQDGDPEAFETLVRRAQEHVARERELG